MGFMMGSNLVVAAVNSNSCDGMSRARNCRFMFGSGHAMKNVSLFLHSVPAGD